MKNTKIGLSIRVLVGAYVLYMAYGIFTSGDEKSLPILAFAVLFVIAGGFLVLMSGKQLLMGEYQGGKADTSQAEVIDESSPNEVHNETVEADIVDVPDAKELAVTFTKDTKIETVEESEITEL